MTLCKHAKTWITVDINNKSVGACCRTPQHEVDTIDINSDWFRTLRNNLNNNIKDERCNACWLQEKTIGTSLRNLGPKIYDTSVDDNADLQYLEIRLGNQCEGSCVYCGGEFSTKQSKFWKIYRNIDKPVIKESNIINETKNLIKNNTHSIRTITFIGGEPSIIETWYEFIDFITTLSFDNKVTVVITTNANWTKKIKEKLFFTIDNFIHDENKNFNMRISGEGDKTYFQGIRKYTDYDTVKNNIMETANRYREKISYTLQPVINGISVYSLHEWVLMFNKIFESNNISKITLNFALLTRPAEFQVIHQGKRAIPYLDKLINILESSNIISNKEKLITTIINQKTLLSDIEQNEEMIEKLQKMLESHDTIMKHSWKSIDSWLSVKDKINAQ